MLRRRLVRLCLPLALPLLACQKPPAGPTTPPDDAAASATPAEPVAADPATPPEAPLPVAEDLLARSIDAVGGKAAIDAIASSYTETKMEITAQHITMSTKVWSKGDNFYVESDMPGVGKTEVWKKGPDIWSRDPINGLRKLEGKEAAQARWSSEPVLAANWREYFAKAQTLGRSKVDQGDVVEVELTSEDGEQRLVLLFDEKTAMPAGMTFEQESPMGAMPIRITYGDFREIAGVKIPFRSVTDMQLMSMVQTTEKHEVNVEIDDAKFDPPNPENSAADKAKDNDKGKSKTKAKNKSKAKSKAEK